MNDIIEKYPKIFQDYEGNPYRVNWDCPKGWLPLLDMLCDTIQSFIDSHNQYNDDKRMAHERLMKDKEVAIKEKEIASRSKTKPSK